MMACKERLIAHFQEQGVAFEEISFPEAYTAQEIAAQAHISGWQLAKVVIVKVEGELAMLVLPAPARIDFPRLKEALGAKEVELARERDFGHRFPDCEVGAMPPFGGLYQMPTYMDEALAEAGEIAFLAGTHDEALRLSYADYQRLAQPRVLSFAH
jgi:Ala-tRNA(Pro) deacylase